MWGGWRAERDQASRKKGSIGVAIQWIETMQRRQPCPWCHSISQHLPSRVRRKNLILYFELIIVGQSSVASFLRLLL